MRVEAARFRWRSGTRFGRPVLPLVCRTRAISSGRAAGAGLIAGPSLQISGVTTGMPACSAARRASRSIRLWNHQHLALGVRQIKTELLELVAGIQGRRGARRPRPPGRPQWRPAHWAAPGRRDRPAPHARRAQSTGHAAHAPPQIVIGDGQARIRQNDRGAMSHPRHPACPAKSCRLRSPLQHSKSDTIEHGWSMVCIPDAILDRLALASLPLGPAFGKLDSHVNGVLIGAQSYSFRDRPLDAAIQGFVDVGLSECELSMGHVEPEFPRGPEGRDALRNWRLNVPLDDIRAIRAQIRPGRHRAFRLRLQHARRFHGRGNRRADSRWRRRWASIPSRLRPLSR